MGLRMSVNATKIINQFNLNSNFMKKVFKFTLAALAATVLASCSNDDFLNLGTEKAQANDGDIIVKMEAMKSPFVTRTAYTLNDNGTGNLYWEDHDKIYTYDASLLRYDEYEYDAYKSAFQISGKDIANFEQIKYAVYFGAGTRTNQSTDWDYDSHKTTLQVEILPVMDWGVTESRDKNTGDRVISYVNQLPMWGEARINEAGKVETDLHYLTAILSVDLKNVPGNVKALYVRGWENKTPNLAARMTGTFKATVADRDEINDEAALDPESERYSQDTGLDNNIIVVNISEYAMKDQSEAVIFIPLIAQKYDSLEVIASPNAPTYRTGAQLTTEVNDYMNEVMAIHNQDKTKDDFDERAWNNNEKYILAAQPLTAKRGYCYALDRTFHIAGSTVVELNEALKTTEDGLIETSVTTKMGGIYGETIEIPAGSPETIELVLNSWTAYTGKYENGKEVLTVVSKNPNLKEFVLNVGTLYEGMQSGLKQLHINLPGVKVTLKGHGLDGVEIGNLVQENSSVAGAGNRYGSNSLKAKDLTIDDAEVKAVSVQIGSTGTVTIGKDAVVGNGKLTVEAGCAVNNVVVNGELKNILDVTTDRNAQSTPVVKVTVGKGAKLAGLKTWQEDALTLTNVTSSGAITATNCAVTITAETGKASSITGNVTAGGDLKIENNSTVSENLTSGGDVTIAVTHTTPFKLLTMTTAEKTLHLNGGYITKVTATKLTIDNEETKQSTAIQTLTNAAEKITSKWYGTLPVLYKNQTNIYTASQLASIDGQGTTAAEGWTYKLFCDADMRAANFNAVSPMTELRRHFDGQNHTITNLRASAENKETMNDYKDHANAGLFRMVAVPGAFDQLVIKNLTIENAEVKAKAYDAGALIGRGEGNIKVWNVTVTGGSVKGETVINEDDTKTESANIGGLIGWYQGGDGVKLVVDTVTVTGVTVEGGYQVGGLIGAALGDVEGDLVTVTGNTFKDNEIKTYTTAEILNNTITSDPNAGKVGVFCGVLQGSSSKNVSLVLDRVTGNDKNNTYNRESLGFETKFKENSTDNKYYYWYGCTDGIIGNGEYTEEVNVNKQKYIWAGGAANGSKDCYEYDPAEGANGRTKEYVHGAWILLTE